MDKITGRLSTTARVGGTLSGQKVVTGILNTIGQLSGHIQDGFKTDAVVGSAVVGFAIVSTEDI